MAAGDTLYEPSFTESRELSIILNDSGFEFDFWKKWVFRQIILELEGSKEEMPGYEIDTGIFLVIGPTIVSAARAASALHNSWCNGELPATSTKEANRRAKNLGVTDNYGVKK